MRNKICLYFVVLFCIFIFPTVVKAEEYSYQYVDYRFKVEDVNGDSVEGLDFQLYDESGFFYFESKYNEEDKYYYFDVFNDNQDISSVFPSELINFNMPKSGNEDRCSYYTGVFSNIVNSIPKYSVSSNYCSFRMNGFSHYYYFNYSSNSITPMILEEKNLNIKKIVFGQLHYHYGDDSGLVFKFFIVNNDFLSNNCHKFNDYYRYWEDEIKCDFYYNGHDYNYDIETNSKIYTRWLDDNILFMRNAVYDYSDELWEQLNSEPIASSEMTFDDSSVININNNNYLSKPSIIQLSKKNVISNDNKNEDSNNNTNIVNIITNPKTWNNGIVVLVISMIVVIGSSYLFIRKRKI